MSARSTPSLRTLMTTFLRPVSVGEEVLGSFVRTCRTLTLRVQPVKEVLEVPKDIIGGEEVHSL